MDRADVVQWAQQEIGEQNNLARLKRIGVIDAFVRGRILEHPVRAGEKAGLRLASPPSS